MWSLPSISTGNSFCNKPSIRKHSSSENLNSYHNQLLHLQQQEKPALHTLPSSPSWKSHSSISVCVSFIFFFFVITIAAFLHCSNIDPPQIVERSLSAACCRPLEPEASLRNDKPFRAWKGLGTVLVRGTRAMNELVVAHIAENTQAEELRLFLRTSYRSGMAAKADFVFLFAPNSLVSSMLHVIFEEYHSFHRLLRTFCNKDEKQVAINSQFPTSPCSGSQVPSSNTTISTFNVNAYRKEETENDTSSQPLWGSHSLSFLQSDDPQNAALFRWGSVVGFDTFELNADDTFGGFFDHPPVSLRRWPCYQMLLGMVRHRFKHVLLTEVSGVAMLRDPFALLTRRRAGLYLSMEDRTWASNVAILGANVSTWNVADVMGRHGRVALSSSSKVAVRRQTGYARQRAVGSKRRSRRGAVTGGLYERVYGKSMWSALEEFERGKKLVNSGVILGGIHQVRGLANAMVTEIVRVAMERANREAFPDNVLLSYLLHKSSSVLGKRVLDHLHILDNADSFVHSLIGSQQPSLFMKRTKAMYAMVHGNNKSKRWGSAAIAIHSDICNSPVDSFVYMDCAV